MNASCVLIAGRPQGLLANGALAGKKFVTPIDAGCGRAEGEKVRVGAAS